MNETKTPRKHKRPPNKTDKTQERHGMRYRPEYQVWLQMKGRCGNPKNKQWKHYGARGITVCERWAKSFASFLSDMGERPGTGREWTVERQDNNVGYCPENCIWATPQVQTHNKRNNLWYEFNGKRMLLPDWARETGMPLQTLKARIRQYGWTIERALTTPIGAPRINSRMLTINGRTQPMCQWAREVGIDYQTLKRRIQQGIAPERAIMPVMPSR